RNLASILRAGADFTLSYATLGVETLYSMLRDRPPVILGEGIGFYDLPVPEGLSGKTLGQSAIGTETGLTVVGIHDDGRFMPDPGPDTMLRATQTLLAIGR